MIAGIMHQGSGLGNQLHRYVATRVLAQEKGYTFGMVAPENFKGADFMKLDMGEPVPCTYALAAGGEVVPISSMATWKEKKVTENGIDVRGYDPEFNFVEDNTIIDGEFQDLRYFERYLPEIGDWLETKFLVMADDICVLGFRGGEFAGIPELFLPREYWLEAMDVMRAEVPDMKFVAVTDDVATARAFLPPEVRVYHEIGMDWRMIRHAKYVVMANSSFYILPALLNERHGKIIAPRGWARRNIGMWSTHQNYYPKFHYI